MPNLKQRAREEWNKTILENPGKNWEPNEVAEWWNVKLDQAVAEERERVIEKFRILTTNKWHRETYKKVVAEILTTPTNTN